MKKRAFLFLITSLIIILFIAIPQINAILYIQSTITSKFLIFIYSSLIIFGVFIIFITTIKVKAIYVSKLDVILSVILGYISLNRYIIQSNVNFSIPYIELLSLGALYIVLRNLSFKSYFWILLAIVISGIFQTVYGNLQLLGYYSSNHSEFKLTGSFFNPGPYAGFLNTVFPIALGMYLFKEKIIAQVRLQITSNHKIVYKLLIYIFEYIPIFGIASIILILPATQSRAAWLGVILSSAVLIENRYSVLRSFIKSLSLLQKKFLILTSIGFITMVLFGVYYLKKDSSDGRIFIWSVTTEMIKENPVFGVGFDRFKAHYMNYQADYFSKNGETEEAFLADNTYYTFNEWLQYIAENGIAGLILLFLLLYIFNKVNIGKEKEYRLLYLLLRAGFIGIGVFAFFSYPMQILPIKLIAIVLLALLANLDTKKWIFFNSIQKSKETVTFIWLFKIAILFFGFIGTVKSSKYIETLGQGFKTWKQASVKYQNGNYKSSILEYKEIYPIFKKNGEFLMNYGKALSITKQNTPAVSILEEAKNYLNTTTIETALGDSYKELKQYKHAEIAYQHASNMIPSRFYPMYLLAKLYDDSGKQEQAIMTAKKILDKEIKVPSTAIKEIQAEMKKIIDKYKLTKE